MKTLQPILARESISVRPNAFAAIAAMQMEADPAKRGEIYCRELRDFAASKNVAQVLASNSLGTIAHDLVALRALDLLKVNHPVLNLVTTDFSSEGYAFGAVVQTRTVGIPGVSSYNTSTGYTTNDANCVDVNVTIDAHRSVQIALNANEAGGTNRDLFGEQVEAMQYALGADLVAKVYALITAANFTNGTVQDLATFSRADVRAMQKEMNLRGVRKPGRALLLNSDYAEKLDNDSAIVAVATSPVVGGPVVWEQAPIAGFRPIEAPDLPTTGNLAGFGFARDAIVLAMRLPMNYASAAGGVANGRPSVITNPDTGLSVMRVDFVDHRLGRAYSRLCWMSGAAKGQAASGQLLTSA